jgi:DNA-binding transcriptional regulator YhcF (GntR family)
VVDAKTSKAPRIENLPTHMEIAIMLNLSRETITRVFQQLQKKNIVAREGPKKLLIQKPEELEKVAQGLIDI